MEKTFRVVGLATGPNGQRKVRFANDIVSRTIILNRDKFTGIQFFELPSEMTKYGACEYLLTMELNQRDINLAQTTLGKLGPSDGKVSVKNVTVKAPTGRPNRVRKAAKLVLNYKKPANMDDDTWKRARAIATAMYNITMNDYRV